MLQTQSRAFLLCLASLFLLKCGIQNKISLEEVSAATKPNSTEGRLITQLINPTDVIVSAPFFRMWMHTSYMADMGFGLIAKCLFFFPFLSDFKEEYLSCPTFML